MNMGAIRILGVDPGLRNNIRLFYDVYADALRGRSYTKDFVAEVMGAWLPLTERSSSPTS